MKLLNFNIGIKIDNTEKVIDFLLEQDADIICLQEVPDHKEDSVDSMFCVKEALDKTLHQRYPYRFFSPLFQSPGLTVAVFGGLVEQGNYILSKFPIKSSANEFFHREYKKVNSWKEMKFKAKDHGRALQTVELDINDKSLRVMNLHGIWTADHSGNKDTIAECKFILNKVYENELPIILAGDFNLLPDTESLSILNAKLRNLVLENNISSTRPDFNDDKDYGNTIVDYIFVNKNISSIKLNTIETNISDHYPLLLEFSIEDGK